ncbi:hypothetical protein ISCGN_028417 [Ixodes scapularis]
MNMSWSDLEDMFLQYREPEPRRYKSSEGLLHVATLDDLTFRRVFRLEMDDYGLLNDALLMPKVMYSSQGFVVSGEEALLMCLRRLAYPNHWWDLEPIFGRHSSAMSSIVGQVLNHIDGTFGHLLDDMTTHSWLSLGDLERFATLRERRILRESGFYEKLEKLVQGRSYTIYGDPAYPLRRLLMRPYGGATLTQQRVLFNRGMSTVRQAVEWGFGKIISEFAFLDFKKNQKLYLQDVGRMNRHLTKGTTVGHVEELQAPAVVTAISEETSSPQQKSTTPPPLDIDPELPAPKRRQLVDLLAEYKYVERIELYCAVNKVLEAVDKRAVLLSCCGQEAYSLISTLVKPLRPPNVEYQVLIDAVQNHIQRKPSELYSRYVFSKRDQEFGESVADYVTALRRLAGNCGFGGDKFPLIEMLRDRLVFGIADGVAQQRPLAEKKLTFEAAYDLAVTAETTAKQHQAISERRREAEAQLEMTVEVGSQAKVPNAENHGSQRVAGTWEQGALIRTLGEKVGEKSGGRDWPTTHLTLAPANQSHRISRRLFRQVCRLGLQVASLTEENKRLRNEYT